MPLPQRAALTTDQSEAVLRRVNRTRDRNGLPPLDRLPGMKKGRPSDGN